MPSALYNLSLHCSFSQNLTRISAYNTSTEIPINGITLEMLAGFDQPYRSNTKQVDLAPEGINNLQGLADSKAIDTDQLVVRSTAKEIFQRADRLVMLPPKNARFFGRSNELNKIKAVLETQSPDGYSASSVTIQGLGGVGKTSLALQYAHFHADMFKVRIWIHSETQASLWKSFSDAAFRFQIPGASEYDQAINCELVKDWLSELDENWLLVFDNAEDEKLLARNMPKNKLGAIIVTTRIPNFSITDAEIILKPFSPSEGTQFLLHMATWENEIVPDESAARAMNKLLDGLPLGITQMTAIMRADKISIQDFLELYTQDENRMHDVNKHGGRHVDYDKDISTVWRFSFQTLTGLPSASLLLGILSLLSASQIPQDLFNCWDRSDGQLPQDLKFCTNLSDLLTVESTLIGVALVEKNPEDSSLSLHRLVQLEFQRWMSSEDWIKAFSSASELLQRAWPQISSADGRISDKWPQCQKLVQHVLSLNRHYLKRKKMGIVYVAPLKFAKFLSSVAWYLHEISDYDNLASVLEGGLTICNEHEQASPTDRSVYASLLHVSGSAEETRGNFHKSEADFLEAKEIRQNLEPPANASLVATLNNLGNVYISLGLYDKAIGLFKESYRLLSQDGKEAEKEAFFFMFEHNMARSIMQKGDLEAAKPLLDRGLVYCKGTDYWWHTAKLELHSLERYHMLVDDHISCYNDLQKARYQIEIKGNAGKHEFCGSIYFKLAKLFWDVAELSQEGQTSFITTMYQSASDVPAEFEENLLWTKKTVENQSNGTQDLLVAARTYVKQSLAILQIHTPSSSLLGRSHLLLAHILRSLDGATNQLIAAENQKTATDLLEKQCVGAGLAVPVEVDKLASYDMFICCRFR